MKRAILPVFVAVLVGISPICLVPVVRGEKAAANDAAKPPEKKPVLKANILKTLNSRIEQNEFSGPLKEILSYLSDSPTLRGDAPLPIVTDAEAFRRDLMVQEVENQPVKLPRLGHVKYETILRLLLDQVSGSFVVKADYIEVTTCGRVLDEINATPAAIAEPDASDNPATLAARTLRKLRVVNFQFDDRPFDEIVKEILESSSFNVLLDPRAKERSKKMISVKLTNVPAQTALRVLADMAELKLVVLDNVYYITTPENADKIEPVQAKHSLKGSQFKPGTP